MVLERRPSKPCLSAFHHNNGLRVVTASLELKAERPEGHEECRQSDQNVDCCPSFPGIRSSRRLREPQMPDPYSDDHASATSVRHKPATALLYGHLVICARPLVSSFRQMHTCLVAVIPFWQLMVKLYGEQVGSLVDSGARISLQSPLTTEHRPADLRY